MASFSYSARDKSGAITKGTLFATDRAGVTAMLNEKGMSPILVKEQAAPKGGGWLEKLKGTGHVKLQDKVIFSRQFATMINAGVPISQSLSILKEQSASKKLTAVAADVAKQVEGGATLANSLAAHPDVFNNIYVNMVRAGETGGILDQVLDRLATQQEKDAEIVNKVRGALIYPSVLLCATLGAFFFLMTVIVPKLAGVFADMGTTLPIYTRITLATSNFMVHEWYFMIGIIVAAAIVFYRWYRTKAGRRAIDRLMLRAPIIGPILIKVNVARFARTFGSLMASGISVLEAINATSSALGNSVYRDELTDVAVKVKNGRPMSEPIRASKHFPAIVGQMLAVGEETGQLDVVLIKLAGFYEGEVDTVVGSITSIIEPVIILILGAVVGFIMISVMGPIANLSSSIQ